MKRIAAVVVTAGLALSAAGCGSSSGSHLARLGSTAAESSTASLPASQESGVLAFARCMRSNGVQDFPDPNSNGGFPPGTKQIARSNPRYQAAHGACRHVLPAGNGPTSAEVQQVMNDMANFARCIRSHGVPNWPDPYLDVGRPTFDPGARTWPLACVSAGTTPWPRRTAMVPARAIRADGRPSLVRCPRASSGSGPSRIPIAVAGRSRARLAPTIRSAS